MAGSPMRAARNRIVREAILSGYEDGIDPVKVLEPFAVKLKEMALDGDLGALKEVFDRVDGKVAQEVVVDEGSLEESLEAVLERISERRKAELAQAQAKAVLTERVITGEVLE